jgi:hypothetical protein
MLDPTSDRIVSAMRPVREKVVGEGGEEKEQWGKWKVTPPPEDTSEGFKPTKLRGLATVKQLAWWTKSADRYGLDATRQPSKAQFFALPVLKDLDTSMEDATIKPSQDFPPRAMGPTNGSTGCPRGGAEGTEKKEGTTNQAATPVAGVEGPVGSGQGGPVVVAPSPILKGYYTVIRESGEHRTYRVRTMPKDSVFAPGKTVVDLLTGSDNVNNYTGVGFADSRGLYVWRKWFSQGDNLKKDWSAIVGDQMGAGKRYAVESTRCYICGRVLTHPESVASGIGPECAAKGGVGG